MGKDLAFFKKYGEQISEADTVDKRKSFADNVMQDMRINDQFFLSDLISYKKGNGEWRRVTGADNVKVTELEIQSAIVAKTEMLWRQSKI